MKRSCIALFLITFSTFLLTASGHLDVIDEYMIFFQAESLALNGSLAVPQAVEHDTWYGREGVDGQPYTGYGPAHAWAVVPFYYLGRTTAAILDIPEQHRDLIFYWGALLSNCFLAALLALLFHYLLCRLHVSLRISFAASLGLVFATPVWPYTGTLFSEIWTALLLLAALIFLERTIRQGQTGFSSVMCCGTCLGLALMSRPNHGAAIPVFAIALMMAPLSRALRVRQVLLLGAVTTLFLGATLGLNYLHFHDVFQFGYADQVEGGKILTQFNTPTHLGLYGLFLSPGKSLFLFVPLVLLALAGQPLLWRHSRPLATVCSGCMLVYALFLAHHTQWEAGYSWGPRYLLPVVPLLLVGMAPLLRKTHLNWPRRALVVLCLVGVLVNLPAVFTSSYEVQTTGDYYDENYVYRMGHNAVVEQWNLFLHYLGGALRGKTLESPLHQGLDLWWVTLMKDGVPPLLMLLGISLATLAGLTGGMLLLGSARHKKKGGQP
ncbi:MAG: hypothetical protein V3R94_03950 [Acidobacteriota bacterium]